LLGKMLYLLVYLTALFKT